MTPSELIFLILIDQYRLIKMLLVRYVGFEFTDILNILEIAIFGHGMECKVTEILQMTRNKFLLCVNVRPPRWLFSHNIRINHLHLRQLRLNKRPQPIPDSVINGGHLRIITDMIGRTGHQLPIRLILVELVVLKLQLHLTQPLLGLDIILIQHLIILFHHVKSLLPFTLFFQCFF